MAVQGVHAAPPSKASEESVLLHSPNQGNGHHSGKGHIVGPKMKAAAASHTSPSPALSDVRVKVRPALQTATAAVLARAYALHEDNNAPVAGSAKQMSIVCRHEAVLLPKLIISVSAEGQHSISAWIR